KYPNILVVGRGRDNGFSFSPVTSPRTIVVPAFSGTAVKLRSDRCEQPLHRGSPVYALLANIDEEISGGVSFGERNRQR
ncbi:MAG TPA: hypothetical protein VFE89_17520, partial [Beijerinckiaceae bacterium]|nr:hypothetical protein [Beijerinckiaceae bacterium]